MHRPKGNTMYGAQSLPIQFTVMCSSFGGKCSLSRMFQKQHLFLCDARTRSTPYGELLDIIMEPNLNIHLPGPQLKVNIVVVITTKRRLS